MRDIYITHVSNQCLLLLLNLGEGVVFDFSDLREKVKMPKRFSTLHMKMLYFDWIISVYYFEQFMYNLGNG